MKRWTNKDKIFLVKNLKEMSYQSIADKLGFTVSAVKTKACEMGIKRGKKVDSKPIKPVEVKTCTPIRVQTCAPKIVIHNGKPLEYWGKNFEAFKQRLSK